MEVGQEATLMNAYAEKMEAQLKGWNTRLEKLVAKIDTADAVEYRGHIDDLKVKHAAAQTMLDELKAAGDEHWDQFRTDIWITWNELENAFLDFLESVQTKAIKKKKRGKPRSSPRQTN
jgi:hypothetical protein